jgi:putative membrane protein PagO
MVIKVGLQDAPPLTTLGLRFLIAGLTVLLVVRVRGIKVPTDNTFRKYSVFLGLSHLAVPYSLVYWGEQHISSGLTAILYATMPFMVAILARIILGDKLGFARVAGIFVGISGVWIIFADALAFGGARATSGVIAILCSVFFASVSTVIVKKFGHNYNPLATLLYPFLIASVLVLGVGSVFEQFDLRSLSLLTWGTIVYLALFGSVVGFALLFWVIKQMDVTVTSYQTFIIPVVAVVLGSIFLDESISARTGIGAAVILAGIAIATLIRRPGETRKHVKR